MAILSSRTESLSGTELQHLYKTLSELPLDMVKKIQISFEYDMLKMAYLLGVHINEGFEMSAYVDIGPTKDNYNVIKEVTPMIDKAAKKLVRHDEELSLKYPEWVL